MGFAWKMVLSLMAVVSMLPLMFSTLFTTLPLGFEAKAGVGYVVRELPGLPLPEGLQEGDVLALEQIDADTRAAAIIDSNLRRGAQYTLRVSRDGSLFEIPVKAVINLSRVATLARISAYPLLLGVLALGLLTLWRGRDWAAWGLTLFALGICAKQLFDFWPTDAITSLWCYFGDRLMTCVVIIPGLYISVDALVGAALPRKLRLVFRTVFTSLTMLALTISVVRTSGIVFYAWTGWIAYARWLNLPGATTVLLPLLLMLIAYRRNDAARRLRIRWVLWSTGLLGASVVASIFMPDFSIAGQIMIALLQGLCMFGYLYAVLRHRVVDISFVIDRALAYGLTTSLVVGFFAILENYVEQATVGNDASFLLQAGATLVLALVLNRVHQRVERLVDAVFFRRQRRAAQELRAFAKQCAFIEQHERLLSLTAERIEQAVGGSGVAIYERRDGFYTRLIQRGSIDYPAVVEVDDFAFVSLRAHLNAIDLDTVAGSALGSDGVILPMSLRGLMVGAIICGARNGEQFAPDEREELAKLAHEVGIALYVLRARRHERFVAAVANGELSDSQTIARRLVPSLTAYSADPGV